MTAARLVLSVVVRSCSSRLRGVSAGEAGTAYQEAARVARVRRPHAFTAGAVGVPVRPAR